MVYQALKP